MKIDSASKGYITYSDIINLANEHKIHEFTTQKLKFVFKNKKITFEGFVKCLLDIEALHKKPFQESYLAQSNFKKAHHSEQEYFLQTVDN